MKYPEDYINQIICGDSLTILKTLPDESVNCVVTSPPYWGLRDYGIEPIIWDGVEGCEHQWGGEQGISVDNSKQQGKVFKKEGYKDGFRNSTRYLNQPQFKPITDFCLKCSAWRGSLGLEPTFELYIKHLCDIFDEVKRVLRKDGSCWVNLGDSYGGSGNASGHNKDTKNLGYKTSEIGATKGHTQGLMPKSLCLIPQRFAIEMVNRGWILRNTIIWHKPNCMPSSANDRFTVDFEYLFFFVKSKKYWFEQAFETHKEPWTIPIIDKREVGENGTANDTSWNNNPKGHLGTYEQGRNKRSVWTIPTQPFPEAHFATFPEKLIETPIQAGCPRYVCKKCGKAREKILEKIGTPKYTEEGKPEGINRSKMKWNDSHPNYNPRWWSNHNNLGLTDCHCNTGFEPGVVLDPFMGAGTTAVVAKKQGKNYLGIELKQEYIDMANKRLRKMPESLF